MGVIITVTRKERFLNAAITQEPLTEAAVTRIEMYLDAIANGSTDVPTPITRVEQYLAKIAGADVEVPTPVTRIEMYLAKVAGEDVKVPEPVTRIEQMLAEWAAEPQGEYKTASGAIVSVTDALPALLKSLIIGIEPVQDLHGYDAPWPAGGGKNLFDKDTAVDGYITGNGQTVNIPDAENMTSDFIPVTAGSQYTYTQWPSNVGPGYWIGCAFYAEKDMSTVIGDGRQTELALVATFTAPEGANYMRIGSRFLKNGKAQLEKGAVSTAYVPYSNICPITGWTGANVTVSPTLDAQDGTTYSISWQSEAGTVYGGSLDVTNGVLTVDRVTETLNGSSSEGWFFGGWSYGIRALGKISAPSDYSNPANIICDRLKTLATAWTQEAWGIKLYYDSSSQTYRADTYWPNGIFDENLASLSAYLSANPLQICYKLATPVTYQLTPQEVALLRGTNNVWADTGDTELTYYAEVSE